MADTMFRPPVNRLMRSLDRSFFQRTIDLRAARVADNKTISRLRSNLEKSKDALIQDRIANVVLDPDQERAAAGRKCILLRPEAKILGSDSKAADPTNQNVQSEPWAYSSTITELIRDELISVIPYQLELDYSHWNYHEIISAIWDEKAMRQDEIPSGFNQVGHVAHLNLRDEFLEYKQIIADIIIDKNPNVTTVINKVNDVGEENIFRTFKYEVLAGPDDLNVTQSHEGCIFKFDYSKVYWNTRLNTEHHRLSSRFNEGEVVCDVMAGIGPFAVPAGKKNVFVWANDLNPDSYLSLADAINRNKVSQYVRPFNEDGNSFIKTAVAELARTEHKAEQWKMPSRKQPSAKPELVATFQQPRTFQHFVMNLPASAITFLTSFIGVYPPAVRATLPANFEMPLIHVYCFNTKSDDMVEEKQKICDEISAQLQHTILPGSIVDGGVEVHNVRLVAPNKCMYCASFRLPEAVAFRTPS